jgi:hypothetical protein
MPNLEGVLKDALVLDASERAALAEKLLAVIAEQRDEQRDDEHLEEGEMERLWVREAHGRLEACRAGCTTPVPAPQVRAKAEKLLR